MSDIKYFNRDLSWLSFNERVLQEAKDNSNSLNERLKFLAIFSSNLDEFYRVRVSKLRNFRALKKKSSIRKKTKPKKVLKAIQKKVDALQQQFGSIFKDKILVDLESDNVKLIDVSQFSAEQKFFAQREFQKTIKPKLKIYPLNKDLDISFVQDKALFFYVNVTEPYLINIPTDDYERFIVFKNEGKTTFITFLDEVIRANISGLIPNAKANDLYSIKITRDGELYYNEDDDAELVELIEESLIQRKSGLPTRILYDAAIPKEDLKIIRKALGLKKTDLMPGGRFHNFSDFFNFPEIEGRIQGASNKQLRHHALANIKSTINHLLNKDELLCFPYHNYNPILNILDEAAVREDVTEIAITLYRISKDSAVAQRLLTCIENGKKVTVFVEAKARFDEENNIEWGRKLEHLGAQVLYSMSNLKVHSKILRIQLKTSAIAYIGTGNFNEKSATVYADFGLLTSKQSISNDLNEVFKFLKDTSYKPELSKIWMSPFVTRSTLFNLIDKEIEISKQGGEGFLFFKMNSLEDKATIQRLYEASNAGVKIQLIVRGICCLIPGVDGLSENIEVISVVGKYLEHARVYYFGNNEENNLFIGSADCMERNLDRRIEVVVPIQDDEIRNTILTCLDLQWHDNTKARVIDRKQINKYQRKGKSPINAQLNFKTFLEEKSSTLV